MKLLSKAAVLLAIGVPAVCTAQSRVRIDFSGTVRMVHGTLSSEVSLGSHIHGWVEIDPAQLPPDGSSPSEQAAYAFVPAHPGFTFDLQFGSHQVHLDSTSASSEGGPTPGVNLVRFPGDVAAIFTMRQQGDPMVAMLSLFGDSPEGGLVTGERFPEDVHLSGLARAYASWSDVQVQNYWDATVNEVTLTIVPEPSLVSVVGLIAGLVWRRGRARRPGPG